MRSARKIGRLLSRMDSTMGRLKIELEDGIRGAGMDEGSVLNIGHQVDAARSQIASRLHDFFTARLDSWARQAWSGYWPPSPTVQTPAPPAPASEQR